MNRFSTVALACAGMFAASSAMAASQASANITGLSFTLIDLNPFDGITPTVSFLTASGGTALSVSATDSFIGESESAARSRPGTFSFTKDYLAELSNVGASASVGSQALNAAGHANGPSTSFSAAASTGTSGGTYSVSLSANTALLINANLSLAASASNGTCASYYCGYYSYSDAATATGSLSLSYYYYDGGISVNYNVNDSSSLTASSAASWSDYYYAYNPVTGWYEYIPVVHQAYDESKSLSDVLSVNFTNLSGQTQYASFGLSVGVSGQATSAALAAPVPEANAMLMSVAGLGMMAWFMRRRRAG